MKLFTIVVILFFSGKTSLCRQFNYPICKKPTSVIDDLIPENWSFKNSATGELISGENFERWGFNFSTNKIKYEQGKISSDKLKQRWFRMPKNTKIKLKDLKMVFQLEIIPNALI